MFNNVSSSSVHRVSSSSSSYAIHPDIHIKSPSSNPKDALTGALQGNKLIYIGDLHGKLFIPKLIAESAKELKEAGADHLAVEFVKFTDGALLREALHDGKSAVHDFLENSWGKHGSAWLHEVAGALVNAHKAGIYVSGIDRRLAVKEPKTAMEKIQYMKKRLSLNVAWDAAAQREAEAVSAKKSIIWGGAGHFTNSKNESPKDMRPGLVISFDLSGNGRNKINDTDQHSHIVIAGE